MFAFREVSAIAPTVIDENARRRVDALCAAGARLLDVDAEDFDDVEFIPGDLAARIQACWVPQSAGATRRGALRSLRPAYALMLEVLAVRWARNDMLQVCALLHLISEYLPILAWEADLGHAADPAQIGVLSGPTSLWGLEAAACVQAPRSKSAARRSVHAANLAPEAWRRYLDREHSHVASALASCGQCRLATCDLGVTSAREASGDLGSRIAMSEKFKRSRVVALRHAAPIGHGFGVPSAPELLEAWAATWKMIAVSAELPDDDYPLPGLPRLVSEIAGAEISPGTLVHEITALLAATILAPMTEHGPR
jgi:hypothetical protein